MSPQAAVFAEQITEHLRHALEEKLSRYAERGRSLEEIGPPAELAQRMLEVVPGPSRWDDLLGPFYGTGEVSRLLGGVSRQAVADRRKRRTLLGLETADNVMVYPAFQFDAGNQVLAGFPEVLQSFRGAEVDDWTLAGWLVSPSRSLEGYSPVQWLRLGRDPAPVLVLARDAARRSSR